MTDLLDFLRTHEEAFRSRARLASLYSDFRSQRHTNPDGYQANASAWLRALAAAAHAGLVPSPTGASAQHDHFTLQTGEDLLQSLQTQEFGRPLAVGSVVAEAVRRRELVPLEAFLEARESLYVKHRYRVPSLGEVVGWGLRQLGVLGGEESGEDRLVTGNFVIVANVEAAAKAVLTHVAQTAHSNTTRIFTHDLFATTASQALDIPSLTLRDLSVLLHHLARDHRAIAHDAASGTIKFHNRPGDNNPNPPSIEQEDITIASLRTLLTTLEPQIQDLHHRVADLDVQARACVARKQNLGAKTVLRQKKLAETRLAQRAATLTQVEEVYAKIEQAADQVELVRVMEASGQTLRALNRKVGGVEGVQDVMEGLREAMGDVEEVSRVVGGVGVEGVDEGEVEEELEGLERGERERQEVAEREERERVEVKEREERERTVEAEAEETRMRLAELEQLAVPGDEVDKEKLPHQKAQADKMES